MQKLFEDALNLLQEMIATPSFSKEEEEVSFVIEDFFERRHIHTYRRMNNIWVKNRHFSPDKPTVLLNSHHDTVRPNSGYTRDPFKPEIIDGKLFGLGSNDAGGPLVSLIATFLHYYDREDLAYNLIMAATAEEEISGTNGIESIWSSLTPVDFAIVGEPTLCGMATAEKGLMVLDCVAKGKPGHAARDEGINAIYEALEDINWVRTYRFPEVSETLGEMKMTVTIINAGRQHNVVPAECSYTIDVRVTDKYTLEDALEIIRAHVKSTVTPRSMRMRPSGIDMNHPLVQSAQKLGLNLYGSPTTSDQALIPVPSVKMGPGDSARSHSADEFIFVEEIYKGIETYVRLLDNVILK
ncbi:MAG TPA: M20 family metallo-hydrolase [Cyclobacteriaceae bacterium]|nr:M20 family metallo-hydrolase [Cyclobacteriaceae bacterium]